VEDAGYEWFHERSVPDLDQVSILALVNTSVEADDFPSRSPFANGATFLFFELTMRLLN
jgi:hypothetical protein